MLESACAAFLQNVRIEVMDWPAQSPDLSLIENLWAALGDRIKNMVNPPTTLVSLMTLTLQRECHVNPQAAIRNVFNSMQRRHTKCINSRGGHTGY